MHIFFFHLGLTENIANVDDHLGEVFLEERQPTVDEIKAIRMKLNSFHKIML